MTAVVLVFVGTLIVSAFYDAGSMQIWLILVSIMSFINLLDFGFSPNFTRYISYAKFGFIKKGREEKQKITFDIHGIRSFGLIAYSTIFVLGSIGGIIYLYYINKDLKLSHVQFIVILAVVGFCIPFRSFYKYISSIFIGEGRILTNSMIDLTINVMVLLIIVFASLIQTQIAYVALFRYLIMPLAVIIMFVREGFWGQASFSLKALPGDVRTDVMRSSLRTGIGSLINKGLIIFITVSSVGYLATIDSNELLFSLQILNAAQAGAVIYTTIQSRKLAHNASQDDKLFLRKCGVNLLISVFAFTFFAALGYAFSLGYQTFFDRPSMVPSVGKFALCALGYGVETANIVILLFVAFRGLIVTHYICFLQSLAILVFYLVLSSEVSTAWFYYQLFLVGPLLVGLPAGIIALTRVVHLRKATQ